MIDYWTTRGETYAADFDVAKYLDQEAVLRNVLAGLDYASVLDVGCGFGRFAEWFEGRHYTGIDLSPSMVRTAMRLHPERTFAVAALDDWQPGAYVTYDLVLASEVLMHIPPADLGAAVMKLRGLAERHLVTVDWTEPIERPAMAHNWLHDYAALEAPGWQVTRTRVGLQTIHHAERVA